MKKFAIVILFFSIIACIINTFEARTENKQLKIDIENKNHIIKTNEETIKDLSRKLRDINDKNIELELMTEEPTIVETKNEDKTPTTTKKEEQTQKANETSISEEYTVTTENIKHEIIYEIIGDKIAEVKVNKAEIIEVGSEKLLKINLTYKNLQETGISFSSAFPFAAYQNGRSLGIKVQRENNNSKVSIQQNTSIDIDLFLEITDLSPVTLEFGGIYCEVSKETLKITK